MTIKRQDIIDSMIEFYENKGYINLESYCSHEDTYGATVINTRFGTWTRALRRAGIRDVPYGCYIESEDILNSLNEFYEDRGEINQELYSSEGEYSLTVIRDRFDTWNNALESAGIPLNLAIIENSDTDILDIIREIANVNGLESLGRGTYDYFRENMYDPSYPPYPPTSDTIANRFGSFPEAVISAGLEPARRTSHADVSEGEIVNITMKHLSNEYPEYDILTEQTIRGDGIYAGRADILIEDIKLVVECKDTKSYSVKSGVGQAIYYDMAGYNAYLCTHDASISHMDIKACNRAEVGLIGVEEKNIVSHVDNGVEI